MKTQVSVKVMFALFLALLFLPVVATAADSPLKVTSFVAKANVTVDQGEGNPEIHYSAEYWVRDDMMRTEMTDPASGNMLGMIQRGKLIYFWVYGESQGRKVPADSEEGQSSINFADIERCLRKARKLGAETVDGVETTKYAFTKCGGAKGRIIAWVRNDDGAIRKLRQEVEGGAMTAIFSDVKSAAVPEDKFFPPERLPFIAPAKEMPEGQ